MNNIVNKINSCSIKQTLLTTQSKIFCNILMLLKLFNKTISNNCINHCIFAKKSLLFKFLPSILLNRPSNVLFKPFNKNNRSRKGKFIATIKF